MGLLESSRHLDLPIGSVKPDLRIIPSSPDAQTMDPEALLKEMKPGLNHVTSGIKLPQAVSLAQFAGITLGKPVIIDISPKWGDSEILSISRILDMKRSDTVQQTGIFVTDSVLEGDIRSGRQQIVFGGYVMVIGEKDINLLVTGRKRGNGIEHASLARNIPIPHTFLRR